MGSVWGIDLGTTNSCISRLEAGRPKAIAIDGSEIVPSVVMFTAEGVVVGRKAQNLELSAPESCVRSVKRRMGRGPSYSVVGQEYTPEQISAEILRALKRGAEQTSGEAVRDVVITVPAYFDDIQRRATIQAGELAGLNVLRLLNEPTSASLIYDQVERADQRDAPEIVMVYDLGGGTFDVSVLEVFGGVREVRATAGNTQLGGDDFDELLYRRFADHLKLTRSVDLATDARARAKLRNLAERTKIALSSALEQRVSEEFVAVDASGAAVHLDLTVTRHEFEQQLRPLLASTIDLSRRAIDDAKLAAGEAVARICLVGGSTRIPAVRALLMDAFPDSEIHEEISPDLAVALGASVQAGMLAGEPVERVLVDVAAHTLGILVLGDEDDGWGAPDTFAPVLRRNTVLPSETRERFSTVVDEQQKLSVNVFQGEAKRASENRSVGSFEFPLRPRPAGSPVDVAFAYDLDGVVRVTVSQPGTDNQKVVHLRLAEASEQGRDTPVLRKARALAATLDGEDRAELAALIEAYEGASPSQREVAEEALLDFFVELEGSDEEA